MLLSVEAREASVEQKEAELESTEKTMERQQSELDQREADLKQQEEQLQQQQSEQMSFQEYQAALSQEDLAALKQVSGIYSKMTPKTAADVITQMSDQNRAAMSVVTITGIVAGIGCIVISIMTSGNIFDFIDPGSIFIVLGGTLCATIASTSVERLRRLVKALKIAMRNQTIDLNQDIEIITNIASVARRDGLLAL